MKLRIIILFVCLAAATFGEDFYFTGGNNPFLPGPEQVRFTCIFNTLYRAPEDTIRISLTILEIGYEDGRKEKTNYISWDLLLVSETGTIVNIYGLNKMITEEYLENSDKKVEVLRTGDDSFIIMNNDGEDLCEYIKTGIF
jgi:hypothetical protein